MQYLPFYQPTFISLMKITYKIITCHVSIYYSYIVSL